MPAKHRVARGDQLAENGRLVVDIGPTTIGIFRVDGSLRAYENTCPHQGGPVCQGILLPRVIEVLNDNQESTGFAFDDKDMHIVCPWHGFEFSIKTGCHPGNPRIRLRVVNVDEEGGEIYVTL